MKPQDSNAASNVMSMTDTADNMLTKVEPFFEDFGDGAYTGWTVSGGTWSAASASVGEDGSSRRTPSDRVFSVLQHAWGPGCLGLQPQVVVPFLGQ